MRIGFVTCHFPPDSIGGGQVQSMRLCQALSRKHEVTVFTRAYRSGLARRENTGSYTLVRRRVINLPLLKSFIDLVKVLLQIKRNRRKIKVYISFHLQLAALMVVLAKYLYGTKAIVSPRGLEDFDFGGLKRIFQKFIYSHSDVILIQSERIKNDFCSRLSARFSPARKAAIEKKIRIFPNGIHVPSYKDSKLCNRPNQLIFVGRLEPIKGLTTLLDALKLNGKKISLLVVGEGSQRQYLEAYAKGLNVTFLGKCTEDEIKEHLLNSRALVLPSTSENFPNVILEAFCSGIPVIGTRVGAVPELIEDGVNGYLVPHSEPELLAASIRKLLEDELKLDLMGKNSYLKVRQFDWSQLVDRFDSIMQEERP